MGLFRLNSRFIAQIYNFLKGFWLIIFMLTIFINRFFNFARSKRIEK